MDTLIKEVFAIFGPSAVLIVIAALIINKMIVKAFKRELEQLRQQGANELEQLKQKGANELELVKEKLEIEKALMTDLRKEFRTEQAIHLLLKHPDWKQRSFEAIKKKLGGLDKDEDELRKILVGAGAVRFVRKRDNKEFWGLIEMNEDKLKRRTKINVEEEDEEDEEDNET